MTADQGRAGADYMVPERFRGDVPVEDRGEAAWNALLDARLALQGAADLLWVMVRRGEPLGGVQPRLLLHELAGTVVTLAGLVERAGVRDGGR